MKFEVGDRVKFNLKYLEAFTSETDFDSHEIQQYRRMVLLGINQTGILIEVNEPLSTVAFPDGWNLPIPTKYIILA
jgi:hypothetical protein